MLEWFEEYSAVWFVQTLPAEWELALPQVYETISGLLLILLPAAYASVATRPSAKDLSQVACPLQICISVCYVHLPAGTVTYPFKVAC